MSSDEQDAIWGRALKQYGEERKKLAALLSLASEYADALSDIATFLKPSRDYPGYENPRHGAKLPERQGELIAKLPTQEQVRNVIAGTIAATKRKRELWETLVAAGVELKD